MKTFYPLKKADPTDFVEPIARYLQTVESQQKAYNFRQNLAKITQLRNKVTTLSLDDPSIDLINKYIPAIQMYLRFALLLAKHLNWNKDFGPIVEDLKITWSDSFNPQLKFMKTQIDYDIFCCFYNLGILYFHKASLLAMEDLINTRKDSAKCAKIAYYLFNRMRTYYYPAFMNTGFSDTNYSHLEMLECLSQGIIYKNMFNLFKDEEYKIGIDKIACLAGLAQVNFFKGYEIATAYFMKSSNIKPAIKSELLSFAYVESLYHDLMFNTRYAKYYEEEMDKSKDNIIYLIAYQRKALRLLDLGLNNQSVAQLIDSRPDEKKQLLKIRPLLEESLKKNIVRNQQIYKKQEIKEEQIPPPKDPPPQYLAKLEEPESLKISYQGPIAAPFAELTDNESKGFMNELRQFSRNRLMGLQSAYAKLNKNVQIIYNDNYVNYYLNLENNSKNKGVPQALKDKVKQIQLNGGKAKLDMEVNILKKNAQQASARFKELKDMLIKEEQMDNAKRNQYGNKWRRQPSNAVNRTYINDVEVYEKKNDIATTTNQKIIQKYEVLSKYIAVVDGGDAQLLSILPKMETSKFLQENKALFDNLRSSTSSVKEKHDGLDSIVDQIKKFYEKLDFNTLASQYYKKLNQTNREKIFDEIFGKAYKLIEAFNEKCKIMEDEAMKAGKVSSELNQKNKGGDEKSKKEYEEVINKFNDVNNLFRDLGQGTAFYTKLSQILVRIGATTEGFVTARQIEGEELQNSLGGKGGFGGTGGASNLPQMYPNQPQQNLGFYVPPPMPQMQGSLQGNVSMIQSNNTSDMLQNLLMSKPNFSTDVFGGNVYQSRYK